ncbi:putative leader peptide [Pseudonocardia oroxyli]|uniref:putative leader peptide n=1 Tax=Pseudonocardia oroxyli TaxID=366584 RepID=UPI003CCC0B8C
MGCAARGVSYRTDHPTARGRTGARVSAATGRPLQLDLPTCDVTRSSCRGPSARRGPRGVGHVMGRVLVRRRHVDLLRVAGACCRPC